MAAAAHSGEIGTYFVESSNLPDLRVARFGLQICLVTIAGCQSSIGVSLLCCKPPADGSNLVRPKLATDAEWARSTLRQRRLSGVGSFQTSDAPCHAAV